MSQLVKIIIITRTRLSSAIITAFILVTCEYYQQHRRLSPLVASSLPVNNVAKLSSDLLLCPCIST